MFIRFIKRPVTLPYNEKFIQVEVSKDVSQWSREKINLAGVVSTKLFMGHISIAWGTITVFAIPVTYGETEEQFITNLKASVNENE